MGDSGIVRIESASGWDAHMCTDQTRIVFLWKTVPVGVAPLGRLVVPLAPFREYDQLAFVRLGPHRLSVRSGTTLATKDGSNWLPRQLTETPVG